jgi:hypothetical protein
MLGGEWGRGWVRVEEMTGGGGEREEMGWDEKEVYPPFFFNSES